MPMAVAQAALPARDRRAGAHWRAIARCRTQVFAIFERYTPLDRAAVSIDEAFLDVTGSAALFGMAPRRSRGGSSSAIRSETGLTGVGRGGAEQVSREAGERPGEAGRADGDRRRGRASGFSRRCRSSGSGASARRRPSVCTGWGCRRSATSAGRRSTCCGGAVGVGGGALSATRQRRRRSPRHAGPRCQERRAGADLRREPRQPRMR